MFSAIYW